MIKKINLFKIYCFIFGIWIFFRTTGSLELYENIYIAWSSPLSKLSLILISLYYMLSRIMPIRNWLSLILLSLISVTVFIFSRDIDWLFLFIIISGIFDKNNDQLVKSAFKGMASGILFVFLLWLIGILPDVVQIRMGVVRHSFGFSLPIILPSLYFCLSCMYIYINRNNFKIWNSIFFLIPVIPITIYCDGRAPAALTLFIFILSFLYFYVLKDLHKFGNILFVLAVAVFIFALLFSFYFAIHYNSNSETHQYLNEIFSGRLEWWNLYWNLYDIELFGQNLMRIGGSAVLEDSSLKMMILDNAYLSLLLEYGLVSFIAFIAFLVRLLYILKNNKDYISMIVWISWLIYGTVSNQLLFVDRNIIILQLGLVILFSFRSSKNNIKHRRRVIYEIY